MDTLTKHAEICQVTCQSGNQECNVGGVTDMIPATGSGSVENQYQATGTNAMLVRLLVSTSTCVPKAQADNLS